MTSQEYTQWLKGFLDAVDNYAITKKQFDAIREKLKEVDDTTQSIGNPITIGNGWWNGGTTTPYSIPLSGTCTTSGSLGISNGNTITYTTGNNSVGTTYTIGGNITSTNTAYVNRSSEDDEKLLLD